jgi:putative Ca2+/H+ antiporter (TMEM165/GDT1 family)
MEAVLLALLIGLLLDQGDRAQHLVRGLGGRAFAPVGLIVAGSALIASLLGAAMAPHLPGRAGLLFFALALILGATGLLRPVAPPPDTAAATPAPAAYGRLALYRLADRSSFLLVAVAAMTGQAWATALGGLLGGLAALVPPLLLGAAYERALPMRILRPLAGALLLLAGLGCAMSALGLL